MRPEEQVPSKWVELLLCKVCKGELLEEILGDLQEYHSELIHQPTWKRRFFYWFEVVNFLRPFALRQILTDDRFNYSIMFRNYFKTSYRSMIKNPLSTFINVFGLAVAIGVCLVVYAFIEYDYSIDRHHENENEVFLATFFVDREGKLEHYGLSPTPLAKALEQDFSSIEKTCRIKNQAVIVKKGDKVFKEQVRFVDSEFLEMLTFPIQWGTSSSLRDINSVIISEAMSIKYFGDINPLGEEILVKFDEEHSKSFVITGVAQRFPRARAIEFDFLINFENLRFADPNYQFGDWKNNLAATFIQLSNPEEIGLIHQSMDKYKQLQNAAENDWAIDSFEFVRLIDLHHRSREIRQDISHDNFYEGRMVLPVVAIFMLALACFNYINIAIVSATKRLKEIGMRKVIGANRPLVMLQFIIENVFVTFIALIVGYILAITVFMPWFLNLSGMPLRLTLIEIDLWIFLLATLLLTGIASGIYPAFYISKFDTINIFKGSVRFGKKNVLTKVLLGIQLVLACVGITGAVMFAQNSAYQASRSWGYDQVGVLWAEVEDADHLVQLERLMHQDPHVSAISSGQHHLGRKLKTTIAHRPDRDYEVHELAVSPNYFETMKIDLKLGRFFETNEDHTTKGLVVNELLVRNLELESPIGEQLKIDSVNYHIIGVVKNFHFKNLYFRNSPTIFKLTDKADRRFLAMRASPGSETLAFETLKKNWLTLFPETPFQGGYQEDVWGSFYEDLGMMKKFMRTLAIIAVLLASLGLYGLVTFNVSGRIKEFSIRKVLGARAVNIARSIIKQYIVLTLTALTIGAPVSYLLIKANIDMMFPHPMPMSFSGVIISIVMLIVVLLAVISTQVRKVSGSNPVEGLKTE